MRLSLSTAILTLVPFVLALPAANAQQAIFSDDFENGSGNWSLEADWHLTPMNLNPTCLYTNLAPSGSMVARFGIPGACGFNVPTGRMTTVAPIDIPADAAAARLRFWGIELAECSGNCGWDIRTIYVSADGGAQWDPVYGGGLSSPYWNERIVDLSAYIGASVLLSFEFAPIDNLTNQLAGWLVDLVRVEIDEPGGPYIYCKSKTNSSGCKPIMAYSGDGSLSGADDLVLSCSTLRNKVWGSFAWSTGSNSVPFNGGTLCVQSPAKRTTVASTGGWPGPQLDCTGTYAWFFSHQYLLDNGAVPGQTIYCQFFGRDILASGGPMTLSNAVAVPILP